MDSLFHVGDSLAYIAPWVLGSVCVGLMVGSFVGRSRSSAAQERKLAEAERAATLKTLIELLKSAEQMTSEVASHSSEIQQTADQVESLQVTGQMESMQRALLGQIAGLLASNKRLQDDLTLSRYHMEEQAQQIDHARREARTDPLTGVSNRKALDEKLLVLYDHWQRKGRPFVLTLVDLDHFKRINDSHGHQAGDYVLEKVGAWLREWTRRGDFVGRYGGDEFAILLPNTELPAGLAHAERLRERAADETSRIAVRGEQVSVSLSIGVAGPSAGDTPESILDRADQALYRSKRQGRNQVNYQQSESSELLVEA
jgi:diguanylate cyclase